MHNSKESWDEKIAGLDIFETNQVKNGNSFNFQIGNKCSKKDSKSDNG